jgi:hypothetical protein
MHRRHLGILMLILATFAVYACGGGGGGGTTATGAATVSLTDAPGDYDHVYVTVMDIWFHARDTAGPDDAGWRKTPLAAPVTVDLIALSNGVIGSPIWSNIVLPVGTYQQIRLILAGTEDTLADSAKTAMSGASLKYNNEIVVGANEYALRVPDAHHGIRLGGTFQITAGGLLRLAIDIDAGHDVVDIQRNGLTEYVLKPSLAYCDLDDAGAIIGSIDPVSAATNTTSSHFVIKAEQVNDPLNPQYHVIRRWTSVNPLTGKFVLYPLKPGVYDIVLRGIGYQTVIIKGVPVYKTTTPTSGATVMPMITMAASSGDYPVNGTITSPTGAWVNFYQTLQDGSAPYEVRFRHFNPITGQFTGFKLSRDPILVGTLSSGVISGLTPTIPDEGPGGFSAAAGAMLYSREPYTVDSGIITSGTGTVTFGALSPKSPPSVQGGNSIAGTISLPAMGMNNMDQGIIFAVNGGMIVNTISIDGQMMSNGGSYTMANLPGGSSTTPLPGALYGVEALGWSSTALGIGLPRIADLRTGDDVDVNMQMLMLLP